MASGLIATGVITLLIISSLFAFFTSENEMEFTESGLTTITTTEHEYLNFTDTETCSNSSAFITKNGEWICTTDGLTSNTFDKNFLVLHQFENWKIGREENQTYSEKFNVYNPEHKEYFVYLAYEEGPLPFCTDSIRTAIYADRVELQRYSTFFTIPDPLSAYAVCNVDTTAIDNFYFSFQWDLNTGDLSFYENSTNCYLDGIVKGAMWDSGGTKYLGGTEVTGKNLSLQWVGESTYITRQSALEKGDWLGFFIDMLKVMGWQTNPEVLPYILQAIIIGIPEALIIIGIAGLLYPFGD